MRSLPLLLTAVFFTPTAYAQEEGRLALLTERYEAAVERNIRPLRSTYVQELQALKIQYTKAGKLDEAVAVDGRLKKIGAKDLRAVIDKRRLAEVNPALALEFRSDAEILKVLKAHKWALISPTEANVVVFLDDNKVKGPKSGWTWKISNGATLTIRYKDGNSVAFDLEHRIGAIVPGTKNTGMPHFLAPLPHDTRR